MTMARPSFAVLVWMFAAYSYGATAVSAAWFLRRDHGLELWTSIGWAALLFSPWVGVGLVVWAVLRVVGDGRRGVGVLAVLTPPTTILAALAATGIDRALRAADWSSDEFLSRVVDRLPVSILLYTAVAAAGLAGAYGLRSHHQKRQMQALKVALDAARVDHARTIDNAKVHTLIVSVGRRRVPVSLIEVERLSSAGNYVVVHWRDQEGLVRETLQGLETRLEPVRFARAHRSTLINLAHVTELRPLADGAWRAMMDSGAELVISRTYRDALLARLGRRIPAETSA